LTLTAKGRGIELADKAKVLVVEDDQDILDTTRLFLESRGYQVLTAPGPDEGTKQLEEGRPDVVVLDVMMPEGTEGFVWLSKLRHHSDAKLRELPVIILSSIHEKIPFRLHEGDADETGSYLPAQAFIDKPIDPDKLVAKIEAVLGRAG
jgi:DNA-binding response OmpR family regulator